MAVSLDVYKRQRIHGDTFEEFVAAVQIEIADGVRLVALHALA